MELKPCPFCNGGAHLFPRNKICAHNHAEVACKVCHAYLRRDTDAEVIAAWNFREYSRIDFETRICTGCCHDESIEINPPAFACCPDSRYRSIKDLVVGYDKSVERDELLRKALDVVEAVTSNGKVSRQHSLIDIASKYKNNVWDICSGILVESGRYRWANTEHTAIERVK